MSRLSKALIGIGLAVVCFVQLLPFYVALTTSLKPKTDLSSQLALPSEIFFGNFASALDDGNILRAIVNSIIVTAVSTFFVCVLGALAAYPLARRGTWVNKVIMLVILSMIMVPPLSILVPLYTMLSKMGGVNTYWGIILVMIATHLSLSVFLYAAFLRTIPSSLEEAAKLDGANLLQTLFYIVFPLLKPVTATVIILTGIATWNEYALSSFILTKPDVQTIAPAIASFFSLQSSNLGAAAAAALLALAPVLIAYLFLQQYFMKGMVAGAEK
ncbi:carbohydrate ABC transporter permease [Salinibacterium sp. SWN1162]|uniref:carbohydrate ABC transporter permease n=1 Tax=Salinibacterium sp. SWN1162 TaxID=2792053 RepID=UPI0018CFB122|nr:carbohydrate ABC transporter permease [Salinibacterium sp. SWN1162]MBH0010260.1 carbohydrate ABC transporter permease [Salinibacterium sp. SWN1162]